MGYFGHIQRYFSHSYIMAASIVGGGNRNTLRKLRTYHRPSHKVASSIARPAHIDCKIDVNLSTMRSWSQPGRLYLSVRSQSYATIIC